MSVAAFKGGHEAFTEVARTKQAILEKFKVTYPGETCEWDSPF